MKDALIVFYLNVVSLLFYFGDRMWLIDASKSHSEYLNTENSWLTLPMQFFTFLGDMEGVAITLVILLLLLKRQDLFMLLMSLLITTCVWVNLKMVVKEPRPQYVNYEEYDYDVICANKKRTDFGFPSGHAMSNTVFYLVGWFVLQKSQNISEPTKLKGYIAASLIIFFICMSRIYL
jgi:membrane-associated phospholipid phosphatase